MENSLEPGASRFSPYGQFIWLNHASDSVFFQITNLAGSVPMVADKYRGGVPFTQRGNKIGAYKSRPTSH